MHINVCEMDCTACSHSDSAEGFMWIYQLDGIYSVG